MALPSNAQTTYDDSTLREDLSDIIYNIDPTETPFASGIARVSATNTKHEFMTDALAAVNTANAQLEGDDATGDTLVAPTRLDNQCQIMRKVVVVSGTQRAVNVAGRADDLDYHVMKSGKALKRDIEAILLSEHGKVVGSTATARQLAGIESWLFTNKLHLAATSTTPGNGQAVVDGNVVSASTATPLRDRVNTVIQQIWTNGGDPRTIMAPAQAKQALSRMPGVATMYRDVPAMSQGQIIGAADVYVSDFGNHTIVPNRFMRNRTILFLDMDYWAIAELRPITETPLAKTGDSDKTMLVTELTLEARNEKASGKIADWAV